MITFPLMGKMGRLGNQLWQIAATIGQARKCETEYLLPKWRYSSFFVGHINQGEIPHNWKSYNEPHFHYIPIPCQGDIALQGYFQSIKYWEHCRSEIFRLFEPIDDIKKYVEKLEDPDAVAIHIRRGDYLRLSDYHTNLGADYYDSAKEEFKGKYYIFSDDIDWCKKNFPGDYYSSGNEIEDLFLMASCPRKIIANSSLSAWAAILGGGKVIAPKQWFGEKANHNTKDLYLPSWTLK
jgi:hypothetical protein